MLYKILKIIFNLEHGSNRACPKWLFFSCPVCKTKFPNKNKTFTEKYLESIDYYNKYTEIYFPSCNSLDNIYGNWAGGYIKLPKGMSGIEIMKISSLLKPQYNSFNIKK